MWCDEFLAKYSDYLDRQLSPREVERLERHISSCPGCSRYDRVFRGGQSLCRSLPAVAASPDFLPRLKHRLYHIDDGPRLAEHRHLGSAALVAIASVGLLALSWLPFATRMSVEIQFPPAVVAVPGQAAGYPDLFGSGPFVVPAASFMDSELYPTLAGSDEYFDSNLFDDSSAEWDAGRSEPGAEGLR